MMTELVRKAELATERLAAQLAARGSGGAAALSACSPGVSPAVGDLIHAVRSSAHVRVSAQGLAGAGSSCGAAPRCTGGGGGICRPASAALQSVALGRECDVSGQWCGYRQCLHTIPMPRPSMLLACQASLRPLRSADTRPRAYDSAPRKAYVLCM